MIRTMAIAAALAVLGGCGIPVGPCSTITDICSCKARPDCRAVTESCYCPNECGQKAVCICGGGKFLSCEQKT